MLPPPTASPPRAPRRPSGATLVLGAGLAVFLALMAWLVASSLVRPQARMFAATPPGVSARRGQGADTLTVDARDDARWRFVDLDGARIVSPPDDAGWDLAVRRFRLIAAEDAADLGPISFDSVARAPRAEFVRTRYGRDTVNEALARWYDYRMVAHVLEPRGHVYAVRTREGRVAKVQPIGYYCPEMRAGCLTLRFAFLPE